MNDKEAFEKWYSEETAEILWEDSTGDEVVIKAWQAACQYKDKTTLNGSRMKQMNDRIEDLIIENNNLKNSFETLDAHDEMLMRTVDVFKTEIKKLREALEFYADNDSYRSKYGGHIQNKNFHSKIGQDCGIIAREALKEVVEK